MSIIIFLIVLTALVFVHELGHFLLAKAAKIRVDEFAIGFPPKILAFKRGETLYSINLVPFGGFVKIFGENPDEASISGPDSARSFINKHRGIQAAVLVAGVTANLIFAWILISLSLTFGLTTSAGGYEGRITNPQVMIVSVSPNSPAGRAGLSVGDKILTIESAGKFDHAVSVEAVQQSIFNSNGQEISVTYERNQQKQTLDLLPEEGIIEGKKGIGVSLDLVGTLTLPPHEALIEGAKITYHLTLATAKSLYTFILNVFKGQGDFSQVTGPVGLVGLIGDASRTGGAYLLAFTAFISINLAVINLVPFPALDGGRLLLVAIEAVRRKTIHPKVSSILNGVGFALLILLMVLVTYKDIARLF